MRSTWYVLENGTNVDPSSCAVDDKGVLKHSSGAKVSMRRHDCPQSIGVELPDDYAFDSAAESKAMSAAKPKTGYKTRGAKAN